MAKISARGNHEVAYATRDRLIEDDFLARDVLVLRSDNKVLGKTKLKRDGRWMDTSYSIKGTLSPKNGKSSLDRFNDYATQRGYSLGR